MCIFRLDFKLHDILTHRLAVGSCVYHRITGYLGNDVEHYVHRCGRTGRAGNKGFAYTFITPEQERYAGYIIRALELSLVPVPDPLST